MNKKLNLLAGLGLLLTTSISSAAVITTGSLVEFATLIADANAVQLDTFDNDISAAESITFDSGVVSTLAGGDIDFALGLGDNSVADGEFQAAVDGDGSLGAETVTFDFGADVVAVGFDGVSFNVGNAAASIDQGATLFEINDVIGGVNGFFGIVDFDTPFQSFQFSLLNDSLDIFSLDNLRFVFASDIDDGGDVEDVPVPATIGILLIALYGLRLFRRN